MLELSIEKLISAIENLTNTMSSGTIPPAVAQAKPLPLAETSQEAKSKKDSSSTVEEVQKALITLAHLHGRKAAVAVLNSFNGANKVGDLEPEQYKEVIAAAANYPLIEVA